MKKKTARILTAALVLSLSLSGCGSASKSAVSYSAGGMAPEAVYETTAAATAGRTEMAEAFDSAAGDGMVLNDTTALTKPEVQGRKLIRTVELTVETSAFTELNQKLQEQVTALSGYIERAVVTGNSRMYGNQPTPWHASITARIPSTQLEAFIQVVEANGNVTYKLETTTDVSLQYSDLESRKKSLTIEQERIWALLEKADSLDAVISLEERLSDIRYELESMESQLRLYDNQVDYSTVSVEISEVTTFTPTAPKTMGERIQDGLGQTMKAMGSFLENLLIFLIISSPVWLTLLLLAVLLLLIIRRLHKWKAGRKGKQKQSTPAPGPGNTPDGKEPPAKS